MWILFGSIAIAAIVMFSLGSLMFKHAERNMRASKTELAATLKDQVSLLKVYRNYLIRAKKNGTYPFG